MKFRDSSGRSTDNPFHFLQQTKKYPVKIKVQELSEREKAEIDFELDYMVTDYQNNKCISKIIMEYFPHFCKKHKLNIQIIKAEYMEQQNFTGQGWIHYTYPNILKIELKKKDFDFENQLKYFLSLFLGSSKTAHLNSYDFTSYYLTLYPRNERSTLADFYRMMYAY